MMEETVRVIKIGGNVVDNPEALARFIAAFTAMPGKKILVHGGGKEATRMSARLEIPTTMIEGRRVTTRETLDVVTMVYAGLVNKRIVSMLQAAGCNAIGLTGADGNAIGGLAVGEPAEKMYEMIEVVNEVLPADRPCYLMGVGTPANILEAIDRGVDMMDCVMPTRNGRNGMLFTPHGIMNMRNRKWADDFSPLQEDGPSYVDTAYSKAYVRHLFIADEILAMQIASIHNLAFYLWLVEEARRHIFAGDFSSWKREMLECVTRRL